jgi:hypothetical protein
MSPVIPSNTLQESNRQRQMEQRRANRQTSRSVLCLILDVFDGDRAAESTGEDPSPLEEMYNRMPGRPVALVYVWQTKTKQHIRFAPGVVDSNSVHLVGQNGRIEYRTFSDPGELTPVGYPERPSIGMIRASSVYDIRGIL